MMKGYASRAARLAAFDAAYNHHGVAAVGREPGGQERARRAEEQRERTGDDGQREKHLEDGGHAADAQGRGVGRRGDDDPHDDDRETDVRGRRHAGTESRRNQMGIQIGEEQ